MKNLKVLLTILLVFLIIAITGFSFAYWDQLEVSNNETIVVGEGTRVVVNEVVSGGKLIPANKIRGVGEVYEVIFTYTVSLSKASVGELSLEVQLSDLTIGNDPDNISKSLVNVYSDTVNLKSESLVTTLEHGVDSIIIVKVTLTEPKNVSQFLAVVNQIIRFKLTFEAS